MTCAAAADERLAAGAWLAATAGRIFARDAICVVFACVFVSRLEGCRAKGMSGGMTEQSGDGQRQMD
jgi:hypothetical protein